MHTGRKFPEVQAMQPKHYISYTPEKLGRVFALLYFEQGGEMYGWHIDASRGYFSAAFFAVESFYADRATRLYRSIADDVYGPWAIDYPPSKEEIRPPVPDAVSHELERVQSQFVEEWLLFSDDPHLEAESAAYRRFGLQLHDVNIRSRKLGRLERKQGTWTAMTAGFDLHVAELLRKYWRLGEKAPAP
jgi:hypothetical protein